ncbi:hypothetical protein [Streptomyces sp. MZ04]|uniref:hypothetical protein n=1 Tax=Streptomyces sp. MZ04 TaxID=2559236 RepID=UPI00107EC827|nr:hypothetical protein [Streptomyces sp. MZ04]TGA93215.1 hypothetical protein E2651_35830 [Streptomyces sp. MZ04]
MLTTPTARLLPWSTPDGKPCYLSSDGSGYLAHVADNIESVQLGMAGDLLDHVAELLNDGKATADQLRFTLACMSQALRDTKRIADSRGSRLPVPDGDPDLIDAEGDDRDDGPQLPAEAFG